MLSDRSSSDNSLRLEILEELQTYSASSTSFLATVFMATVVVRLLVFKATMEWRRGG